MIKQIKRVFGIKNEEFESLTELKAGDFKIRVWRTEPSLHDAAATMNLDLQDAAKTVHPNSSLHSIVRAFYKLPRVACVAVTDDQGNGVSAYQDWH